MGVFSVSPKPHTVFIIISQILYLGSPLLFVAIVQGFCMKYDWLRSLKKPLDFGKKYKGKRIFGDHKTFRGFFINVVFCIIGAAVQAGLQTTGSIPSWLILLDYGAYWPLLGLLLGIGMTAGELPNSFLKRKLDISPGGKKGGLYGIFFFLFDQVDLTIGIWICIFFLVKPSLWFVLCSFILTFLLHITVSSVGYLLGMRKTVV